MQSPVNWALLGLVIERPSYAYELAKRFERTYGTVLTLSAVSHAYTALAALRERELIEEMPGTRTGRQPKPHYRATAKGAEAYGMWLVGQVGEDLRRHELFVLQFATFTGDPPTALKILERYEDECLMQARDTSVTAHDRSGLGRAPDLAARLASEDRRVTLSAKLAWVQFARGELNALRARRR